MPVVRVVVLNYEGGDLTRRCVDAILAADDAGMTLDFAVRYLKDVVEEFGVEIEYRTELDIAPSLPARYWTDTRFGVRHDLATTQRTDPPPPVSTSTRVARALVPQRLRPAARKLASRVTRKT